MSLIRRDHIAGHTHDRSRSSSIDGEIDYSLWTLEKVLQWLEDNSFSEYKQIFIDFFALRDLRKIKHLLKNETEGRYKLITAIRKIGERPSFSDKSSQDLLGGLRDTYGSLSYSPTTHNSSQTRLSAPSLLEATTNKTLKLSTSFPDLRNANNHQNNHSFSPTINPRSSSIDNEKWSKPTILTSIPFLSQDPHDQSPYQYNNNNGYLDDKTPSPPSPISRKWKPFINHPANNVDNINNIKSKPSFSNGISNNLEDPISSATSTLNNFTNLPKHNFQLTFDFKNFRLVELSGDEPRSKIKRVIFSQLDIDPNDCENYTFHLTELGQKEIGPRLEDNDLIHKCLNADDRGTLKFFVKHRSTTEPIYHNLPIMASQNELRANSSPSSFYTSGKYFSGGFNPTLQEGWKSTEEFSPITAEPSDIKYDLQDIKHELVDTIENVSNTKKKFSDSSKGGGKLARAVSLRRGVESWIVRPTTEDVLENLEQFFPGHDLDKPITETPGTPVTPVTPAPPQNASQQEEISPSSKVITEKSNGNNGDGGRSGNGGAKITRYKSIRSTLHEVHEREKNKRFIEAVNAVKANQRLARKPTTKFWGKKAVEQRPMKFCEQNAENNIMQDKTTNYAVKWVKGELIGKGTFGKVYIALNVTTSEMMAVKQVETPRTRSDEINQRQRNMVKSFKDEMKILKDLDHDHIVQYIGYEENEEEVNIFLEYVNGGSIGTYLRMNGPLKEPVVRSFTRQILLGLQYLHNRGILHRDIKADNILVNEDGICKISDFGISKKSGTIFWMAPEVFTKGYSAKVDIWSLGCVILEMFAGERPWPNLSDLAAMFKLGSEKKAPPIREDLIMSAEARDCLDKCFIMPTAEDLLLSHPFVHDDPDFHFK
ncbi:20566_t:CDS:10 [Entrophospora sp. SA101]|nr:20566_t:CDS:10 [Entrophospora sp. SA101]